MKRDRKQLANARRMRRDPTPAERRLWALLRNRRLAGFKFRFEHPIGPYTADFYCAAALVVVEVDGESHLGREEYDAARDEYFRRLGLVVLRFANPQVYDEPDDVIEQIANVCAGRVAALPPHPRHAGARHWKRTGKTAPSPVPSLRSGPTSPPGER